MLTNMVLGELAGCLDSDKKLKILVTSGTKEGYNSLTKGRENLDQSQFDITVTYFPFDAPFLMKKAFHRFAPKLAVIVETELWPGFLITAKQQGVPVLLINGRMSEKSFKTYKYFQSFFETYGPEKVWAISELDGGRFGRVMGQSRVEVMNNIKFDRINPVAGSAGDRSAFPFLPDHKPFVLLGSIRREEEEKITRTVQQLQAARSDLTIGIFPKHITRADIWQEKLAKEGIKSCKRSALRENEAPQNVIIWDVFGELAAAYNLADATFVGGSLINLGGQNFLEPLVFGLSPVIGPYWKNFAWVGREIVSSKLVTEVTDEKELAEVLLEQLTQETDRNDVILRVTRYFEPRKGGTRLVCQNIAKKLYALEN